MTFKGAPLESKNQAWETPPDLVQWIENKFNVKFTLDAAGSWENRKAPFVITKEMNALEHEWITPQLNCEENHVWLNPPFGHGGKLQRQFIEKAISEVAIGNAASVYALIPARTDTRLFHDLVLTHASAVFFLKGRCKFGYDGDYKTCAPFPSMLVVFESRSRKPLESLLRKCFTLTIPSEARQFS